MSRKDWLLLGVVFVVSEWLGVWVLSMAGLGAGSGPSMGLSLLFATSMSAICGYIWRIRSYGLGSKSVQITTTVLLLLIAAVAFLFGAKFNGETLLYVAAHGMPNWSGFGLQRTWAWVLLPALGVAYIQIWTLVRGLLNAAHRP